ncbi:MAG: right-handed parallel beta-helix repeat-containing protein, partial [Planctomycetes bacterium]|nr:right-handed parallel beta-helix repeat-containing protein [Planctomycetota bacterium]
MKRSVTILTLALLVLILAGRAHAETLIVEPGETIQSNIDDAADGDTVVLLNGVYQGEGNYNIDFRGKAITLRSVAGRAMCIIAAQGDFENPRRVFIFQTGEGPDSIIDGITIATGFLVDEIGAGILCTGGASPTIQNCTITSNMATGPKGAGGGIACWYSSPVIRDNVIVSNYANGSYGGGGIYCYGSDSEITENTIAVNLTLYDGGGIYSIFGAPVVTHNSIVNNGATRGGGMCCWMSPSVIQNNLFVANEGDDYGGGLYCRDSSAGRTPTIVNNTFTENILLGGGEEGPFGREIAFYAFNGDVINSIIWRNDYDAAIARYDPGPPEVLATGTGAIGEDGVTLTSTTPAGVDWIADFVATPIVPIAHVVILTEATGTVTPGTYAIASVSANSITLAEEAGDEPDPAGPYGTATYA